jgi:outer membrane protein
MNKTPKTTYTKAYSNIPRLTQSATLILALFTLLAGVTTLLPISAHADDLLTVYRKALKQDTVIEAAKYALEAAEQKWPQARAGLLPTLNWSANKAKQSGTSAFAEAEPVDRAVRNNGWTLQLTQALFRPGNWVAYSQAGAQVRQAQAQYTQAQQELILRVAQSYFDVVVANESVQVAWAQDNSVAKQLELAKRNFQVGTSTVTDVHEAQSRYDLSKAQRIGAVNDLEAKQAELERILGEMPKSLAPLQNTAIAPLPSPPDLTSWSLKAKEQHPLVQIAIEAKEVADREITKNQTAHLPTLDLTATRSSNFSSGSLSSPTDLETRTKSHQLSLQLVVPLYSGGATHARVQESVASLKKAHAELEGARRQAATLARQAFSGVMNGQAQIEALTSAVESSKSSVNANKIGYKIGTRINIDVLNAEQQLFAAMRDLSKARVETFMQGLRLKASIGTLNEADVETLNASLSTNEDFPSTKDAQPVVPMTKPEIMSYPLEQKQ